MTDIATNYAAAVNTRNLDGLIALFEHDAALRFHREVHGVAAIRAFYADEVFRSGITIREVVSTQKDAVCVALFEGDVPDAGDPVHLVDVFQLSDSGRIADMEVFRR
jgi:hypothetical protein